MAKFIANTGPPDSYAKRRLDEEEQEKQARALFHEQDLIARRAHREEERRRKAKALEIAQAGGNLNKLAATGVLSRSGIGKSSFSSKSTPVKEKQDKTNSGVGHVPIPMYPYYTTVRTPVVTNEKLASIVQSKGPYWPNSVNESNEFTCFKSERRKANQSVLKNLLAKQEQIEAANAPNLQKQVNSDPPVSLLTGPLVSSSLGEGS
jgi:hypothetical protein